MCARTTCSTWVNNVTIGITASNAFANASACCAHAILARRDCEAARREGRVRMRARVHEWLQDRIIDMV